MRVPVAGRLLFLATCRLYCQRQGCYSTHGFVDARDKLPLAARNAYNDGDGYRRAFAALPAMPTGDCEHLGGSNCIEEHAIGKDSSSAQSVEDVYASIDTWCATWGCTASKTRHGGLVLHFSEESGVDFTNIDDGLAQVISSWHTSSVTLDISLKRIHQVLAFIESFELWRDGNLRKLTYHHYESTTNSLVYKIWVAEGASKETAYATSVQGAGGVITHWDRNGELYVLLVAERGKWKTAGGAVDPGESLLIAAAREVKEEIGVDLLDAKLFPGAPKMIGHYNEVKAGSPVADNYITYAFECNSMAIDCNNYDPKELKAMRWFKFADIEHSDGAPVDLGNGKVEMYKFDKHLVRFLKGYARGGYLDVHHEETTTIDGTPRSVTRSYASTHSDCQCECSPDL